MSTQAVAAPVSRASLLEKDRRFFAVMAWTIGLMVVAAFAKAVIRNEFEPGILLSPLTHAHAAVFLGWTAVFVAQPTLVVLGRTDLHRRLGKIGIALACAMPVLSIISTIRVFALGMQRFFFADPHVEVIVFAILAAPAFLYRRNTDLHARLILLATISLIGAATAHLPFIGRLSRFAFLYVQDAFIVAAIVYDAIVRRRVHPAYWWGTLLIVVSQYLVSTPPTQART
ncbi:MAG TPA: hypothetical protein VMU08_14085 [Rhizomicrobium sp.]|nr:hypothetical protein [Rhizomicrobium sp.]